MHHYNCFIYALKHNNVPDDEIERVKTRMKVQYTKTKDIGFISKKVGLGFIIQQARDCISRDGKFVLGKPDQKKINT